MHYNGIIKADWYNELVEDCQSIIVEYSFVSRWALIEGYHKLGERILKERENCDKYGIAERELIKRIAKSIGKSEVTIYKAVQFARKFPNLNALPEGKDASWYRVVNKYLPSGNKEKEKEKRDKIRETIRKFLYDYCPAKKIEPAELELEELLFEYEIYKRGGR